MNKPQIIAAIKRIATEDGKAPGQERFRTVTGIGPGKWRGVHWTKWSQALKEAGFSAGRFNQALSDEIVFEQYVEYVRELKKLPTTAELKIKRRQQRQFPSHGVFARYGTKRELLSKIEDYCRRKGYGDVIELIQIQPGDKPELDEDLSAISTATFGCVYLFKYAKSYKIGRSDSPGRREYELGTKLPEKLETVHVIRTDDPIGIEAYWHNRFADKRGNGEWFKLTAADVAAFKRWKKIF
jgi:hypothetical protein